MQAVWRAVVATIILMAVSANAVERRMALVIGNAAYPLAPLATPLKDSEDVARALLSIGFEVRLLQDATYSEMISAVNEFSATSRQATVRLLYFAGHGLQIDEESVVFPVDGKFTESREARRSAVGVQEILDRMSDLRSGVSILILDACRNNPLLSFPSLRGKAPDRTLQSSVLPGMREVDFPAGVFVSYATSPGEVAADTPIDGNSVYTRSFLDHVGTPDLPIESVFKRVRMRVVELSGGRQTPWDSSSVLGNVCLVTSEAGRCG